MDTRQQHKIRNIHPEAKETRERVYLFFLFKEDNVELDTYAH